MDDWENFSETLLSEKEDYHSHLNIKYIADVNYAQAEFKEILN